MTSVSRVGWAVVELEAVCHKIQDGAHHSPKVTYELRKPGTFPYVTSKNIRHWHVDEEQLSYVDQEYHDSIYPRCNAEFGDVLLTKDGANTGQVAINTFVEPISLLSSVCLIKPDAEKLDARFLVYYIQSDEGFENISGQMTGAAIKRIVLNRIKSSEIPLPPLDEQKRIVAKLDQAFAALDRARANAEANLADAQALFDAWLTAVFHDHPSSWRTEKLHSLCKQITVGHVGSMAERYTDGGIPFLRSQNIRPFHVELADVKWIDKKFHSELSKSSLAPGDVAIVRTGYPGTAAVIPENLPVSNCADLVIVRPKESIAPEFLVMFLNSTFGKQMVAEKAVGAAQKHFNVGAAKQVDFSFPGMLEQEQLVQQAQQVRNHAKEAQASFEAKLADIAALRQSLLQAAFSGQLT